MKKSLFAFSLIAIISLFGCSKSNSPETVSDTAESTNDTGVTLRKIGFSTWDKQLKAYQPNIVVVDAWAMWCSSCIKRFPKMVELDKKYREKPVTFVSLNLDDHTNTEAVADAEEFLINMGATFDNFHIDENLIDAFEHFDLIGIPAVFIYDQNGEEKFRLTGDNPNNQFTEKDIESSIIVLLNN